MKAFKLASVLAGILSFTLLVSCAGKVEDPSIIIEGENTIALSKEKASFTVKVLSNRDWGMRFVGSTPDWIVAEPGNGKASKTPTEVKVTVTENTGANRTAAVEFYTGIATAMLTIVQAGPKGESDGVEALTVLQFINKADKTTYYRLTGTVSAFQTGTNSSGKDWMQFNLTDDSGTILVYGFAGGQYEEWSGKIKNGGTVTLQGQYEFYSSKSQHEVVNAVIDSFTAGKEQTDITESTVADFIAKASASTYYRLTGTVSEFKTGKNSSGKDWMQFSLTDKTGTILVYGFQDGQFEEWSAKIKDNGTVTLVGTYEFYSQKSQHEVTGARIESFSEGQPVPPVTGSVTDVIAAASGSRVTIAEATVSAVSTMGIVVTDGTSNIYVFFDSAANETVPDVAVGDKVKVEATKATYGGVPELKTPAVTRLSSGTMTYPEPKDLNPLAATYASEVTEYVTMTGSLTITEDPYYNVTIPGVDPGVRMGSLSGPVPSLGIDAYNGKQVTIKGYFTGLAGGSKYINIVVTEIALADPGAKYFGVTPAAINARADDTSASFKISSNADWTISCDNSDFTLSATSGSGDATVTVSFAANGSSEARVANIGVSCPDAGIDIMVVLTQAKASGGEQTVVEVNFREVMADLPQSSGDGLKEKTFTWEGYEFFIKASTSFYQAKTGDVYYLLIGKANSYIQLPAIDGKALVKVEFTTGPNASENAIIDVAKADGTRLNVNTEKIKKGTKYEWNVPGEVSAACRLLVTNAYNAQFQYLTLTYE